MYRYEQLQLVMIDEISLIDVIMINVINNRLMFIKHIQNKIYGGLELIMINDFDQASHVKVVKSFKISGIILMHQHPFFDKHMSNVMN